LNDLIIKYLPSAVSIITLLAFSTSLITEVIKDLGFMKKIPTNLVVLVVSIVITVLAYLMYCSANDSIIYWYGVVGAFLGSFIVAYIATYGWDKLHELYLRFKKKKVKDDTIV